MSDFPSTPWRDLGYWQKRKKDKWRLMAAPTCQVPVVDTHCHLSSLSDPVYAIARAACLGVEGLCTMVDPTEDDPTFAVLDDWAQEAKRLSVELSALSEASGWPGVGESLPEEELVRVHQEALAASGAIPFDRDEPKMPWLRIGVGCHPHNARLYDDALELRLAQLAHDPRIAVLGEIGLDYHYDLSPREVQKDCFRRQIRLAKDLGLPIALHVREAHDDAFGMLEQEGFPEQGVLLHCCSLAPEELACWVEAGCWIAYGGPLTFSNAEYAREGARTVPMDRLLTETDSPYMTPVPLRGVECSPDYVGYTAQRLADLLASAKGVTQQEALACFARNAREFLGVVGS